MSIKSFQYRLQTDEILKILRKFDSKSAVVDRFLKDNSGVIAKLPLPMLIEIRGELHNDK